MGITHWQPPIASGRAARQAFAAKDDSEQIDDRFGAAISVYGEKKYEDGGDDDAGDKRPKRRKSSTAALSVAAAIPMAIDSESAICSEIRQQLWEQIIHFRQLEARSVVKWRWMPYEHRHTFDLESFVACASPSVSLVCRLWLERIRRRGAADNSMQPPFRATEELWNQVLDLLYEDSSDNEQRRAALRLAFENQRSFDHVVDRIPYKTMWQSPTIDLIRQLQSYAPIAAKYAIPAVQFFIREIDLDVSSSRFFRVRSGDKLYSHADIDALWCRALNCLCVLVASSTYYRNGKTYAWDHHASGPPLIRSSTVPATAVWHVTPPRRTWVSDGLYKKVTGMSLWS